MNARQQSFCELYARTHNATESAKMAGYADKSAHVTACRLLKKANVRSQIERLEAELLDRQIAKVEERKAILTEIFRAKPRDFVNLEQQLCPHCAEPIVLGSLIVDPERLSAAVHSVTQITDKHGNVRYTVKLRDPVVAIAELNKMDGVYKDSEDNEATTGPTADQLARAMQRYLKGENGGKL